MKKDKKETMVNSTWNLYGCAKNIRLTDYDLDKSNFNPTLRTICEWKDDENVNKAMHETCVELNKMFEHLGYSFWTCGPLYEVK